MGNNREALARGIAERFIGAISGTDREQIVLYNPEDRIYVGKLSPQSGSDSFSSNVLIQQISVDFRIPREDAGSAVFEIAPQGCFFYRVLPTLEQQREFFRRSAAVTFRITAGSFGELAAEYRAGGLTPEARAHRARLLPVYEKIALERRGISFPVRAADIYDEALGFGSVPEGHPLYAALREETEGLCREIQRAPGFMPCRFREDPALADLLTEESWRAYLDRQLGREEFRMLPRFDYSLAVELRGSGDYVTVTVALSNETAFGDEGEAAGRSAAKDPYRINTLFNSGLHIRCSGARLAPIELDYFADDYKYDRYVYALGSNCSVECDRERQELQTTHVPVFFQHRLKTNDQLAVRFADLIRDPVGVLDGVHSRMLEELERWKRDYAAREASLTGGGRRQFQDELDGFSLEIRRFRTGIDLIRNYNMVRKAFQYMNEAFRNAAGGRYDSWRLFQIVFVVSLILDLAAHEPDLMLDEELVRRARTDDVDILYFPTGGGKTEAFLGIMVFNLFFDRLRGKRRGVTAILKYPLRLLSVQQVQRVSNILAQAELLRRERIGSGAPFALGYFVGERNTPNRISGALGRSLEQRSQRELDGTYRLLDVCPFCGRPSVHVAYDREANSLRHVCREEGCPSRGIIPLYMVDDDIYRFLPSVVISTVDKMTAVGMNARFHNLLCGADAVCPKHGFTGRGRCWVKGCDQLLRPAAMKDPAPTLLIQDELHLIKESLGAYDAHYETLIEYFIRKLSGCGRGLKVIGATATIAAYAEQAKHLYWKNAVLFPAASPYLDRNFYAKTDPEDVSRIILGYAPFGKAIVNSVAYSLQYLRRVVWELYRHPEQALAFEGMALEGSREEKEAEIRGMLEDYWVILEYNNVKLESNRILQALEDPINTELAEEGIRPLVAEKMTGDDTFQEVRATLSAIEHADSVIRDLDFNLIAATSMISHGVDADRFNLMMFYGMPGSTAEYIQAYSRVGRKHTGLVIDIIRPTREKDRSYLKNFRKFHEYKDILVDSVAINRWAVKAVENTLPGVVSALLLNYYLYTLQDTPGLENISQFEGLKRAFRSGAITAEALKAHAYGVYKCSDMDSSAGLLYRDVIDREIDRLVDRLRSGEMERKEYLLEVFNRCHFHVMQSLRDTDRQIIVELK